MSEELCICLNNDVEMCIDGTVYSFCDIETCGGICEPCGSCQCVHCHRKESK